jgi:hypothetical protein
LAVPQGLVVRDARSQVYAGCVHLPACRAPHHEGPRTHPESLTQKEINILGLWQGVWLEA